MSARISKPFFFHQPEFIFRHENHHIISFPEKETPENAALYFSRKGAELISLDKSPFGGFVFKEDTRRSDLIAVTESVLTWGSLHSIERIIVRCAPEIYSSAQSMVTKEVLTEIGFTTKHRDITQVIQVNVNKDLLMNTDRKRRWKKCIEEGFIFKQLRISALPEAYALFKESREQKGYPLTMKLKELTDMFDQFPHNYLLFGIFDIEKMIAASVSIVVNSEILYCFYLGDSVQYRQYSPVTFLVAGIYDFCRIHRFKLMDLGLSTDKGLLNEGLYSFKKSLGCIDSEKLTFEKII